MELRVTPVTFPEIISFNYEELKQGITAKTAEYANLVYSDEQVKEAKKDKANLNKFAKALSEERIKVKKQCLAPYEDFEKKVKELEGIVGKATANIDKQIKEYDLKKKEEKKAEIQKYFGETIHPEWLSLDKFFDQRWLNVSVSMTSVKGAIDTFIDKVVNDLTTLSGLEFAFESIETYKSTLDIGKSIQEGQRLADIQRRKEQAETERKAREEAAKKAEEERRRKEGEEAVKEQERNFSQFMNAPETEIDGQVSFYNVGSFERYVEENLPKKEPEPVKEWVSFKALLSPEDALELKGFFDSKGIKFEPI